MKYTQNQKHLPQNNRKVLLVNVMLLRQYLNRVALAIAIHSTHWDNDEQVLVSASRHSGSVYINRNASLEWGRAVQGGRLRNYFVVILATSRVCTDVGIIIGIAITPVEHRIPWAS
jgi:hypothetical protein